MKDPKAEGSRWLEQARRDLAAAKTISEEGLWWVACFQAQQAAEKAVKAYLYSTGERIVLGHSVAELIEKAAEKNQAFGKHGAGAARLDRFYIPTRYPNGLPGGIPADTYAEEDARQALDAAEAIVAVVSKSLD